MKSLRNISIEQLAALICQTLANAGITVTLSGGACVAIWSKGKYISHDLDFIEEGIVSRKRAEDALNALGFSSSGRHFVHPETKFFVEFPAGPLMVGDQRVQRTSRRKTVSGTLRLLTPTDCVKDRLAAYFHWNDGQSLEQALLVAKAQRINLADVRRWAKTEEHEPKFRIFEQRLRKPKSRRKARPRH